MRFVLCAALVLSLAVFAACGDDDGDTAGAGGEVSATAEGTADATDSGDDGGEVRFVEIDAVDFSFDPAEVTVAADTELTFAVANTGSAPHTLTVYSDKGYTASVEGADTGNMPSETVGEFVVALDAGEYFFRCEVHPGQMQGTIVAE